MEVAAIVPLVQRSDLNLVVKELYTGVTFVPVESFIYFALDMLKGLVHFDSALWASGARAPLGFSKLYRMNLSNQIAKLLDNGFPMERLACSTAVSSPGVATNLSDLMPPNHSLSSANYKALLMRSGI